LKKRGIAHASRYDRENEKKKKSLVHRIGTGKKWQPALVLGEEKKSRKIRLCLKQRRKKEFFSSNWHKQWERELLHNFYAHVPRKNEKRNRLRDIRRGKRNHHPNFPLYSAERKRKECFLSVSVQKDCKPAGLPGHGKGGETSMLGKKMQVVMPYTLLSETPKEEKKEKGSSVLAIYQGE